MRRTREQIRQDRDALVELVTRRTCGDTTVWILPPRSTRPNDIAALVKAGRLRSQVEQEWDPQVQCYSYRRRRVALPSANDPTEDRRGT